MKLHNRYEFIAIIGFVLWGLYPPYFKLLASISSFEILLHRIVWSCAFTLVLIICTKKSGDLLQTLRNTKVVLTLFCTSLLISINWGLYVVAISNNMVLEASLGYYISPLLTIFMGILFLKEQMSIAKNVAIAMTIIALATKMVVITNVSYLSIGLAITFSGYGFIKKSIKINSLLLFCIEMCIAGIPALLLLIFYPGPDNIAFQVPLNRTSYLLMNLGLITSIPIILFNHAVKHVALNIIGFIQYITPTMIFLLAIFLYDEHVSFIDMVVFAIIWGAIILVKAEQLYRKRRAVLDTQALHQRR